MKYARRITLSVFLSYATFHASPSQRFLEIGQEHNRARLELQWLPEDMLSQLPAIVQPKHDVDGKNGIKSIYYDITFQGKTKIEYNVVFEKESYPIKAIGVIHDFYHDVVYGRKEDIETIELYFENGMLKAVGFPGAYSGEQGYAAKRPKHGTAVVSAQLKSIYVNTWNHLFSERDMNESLEKYYWKLVKNGDEFVYKCGNGLEAKLIPGSKQIAEQEIANKR